jgi:N-acyl-D-aspartate/D-glutamate deacylase
MSDLVIRNAAIVDGSGRPPFHGDITVDDGIITEVGPGAGRGREEIDADGLLVTPGFVDTHTHYDGQATWDPMLSSSCWHGVTTVTMGNCGVGFAPAPPGKRDWLIGLMEGVEEIPGSVLAEGMAWDWESFPEYLDALDAMPRAIDVACQVAHGPLRAYVMGERGAANEPATAEDIARMTALMREAMDAGAFGFTTSRTVMHKGTDGKVVPGTYAAEDEIFGIGSALRNAGRGVFEVSQAAVLFEGDDPHEVHRAEMEWMRRLAKQTGRPVVYGLVQNNKYPDSWRDVLAFTEQTRAEGIELYGMTSARPTAVLTGLQLPGELANLTSYFNPLRYRPTYKAALKLPLDERVAHLRDPETKRRVLSEQPVFDDPELAAAMGAARMDIMFSLGEPVNYEPAQEDSILARAHAAGRDPEEYLYDALLTDDGLALFLVPLANYSDFNGDAMFEMISSDACVVGLGDGGAHVTSICDASNTTYMLTHWARDRTRGECMPVEWAVRKISRDTAALWGMNDRGMIRPGMKADINVIDFENLRIDTPRLVRDLPAGGARLIQTSAGYVATINGGQIVMREGEDTGARPGRLMRSNMTGV